MKEDTSGKKWNQEKDITVIVVFVKRVTDVKFQELHNWAKEHISYESNKNYFARKAVFKRQWKTF